MSKTNINVTVTDTDIRSIMNKLFTKEPLKDSYVELFTNVMINNHRLFNHFFSISLRYESYYETYKSSEFNKQGNIPCIVTQISSVADWSNLSVRLPKLNEGDEVVSNIRLGDFTLANEDLEIENSIFC